MTLKVIQCTNFRCLESAELEPAPGFNLIYGANASGKTSLLEAIGYLGRGRSFRGASTQDLVRSGSDEFLVFGRSDGAGRDVALGVRNGRAGIEIHVGGEKAGSAAALAEQLPLQVIDPDVHELVAGGPELRRRYLDWIAFHVEQGYLENWRSFRRALKQRNAALRNGQEEALAGWDAELAEVGGEVDAARRRMLEILQPDLEGLAQSLLGSAISIQYQRGWSADHSLREALAAHGDRERQLGSTQSGPHRADLRLGLGDHRARKRVSRGQQKLMACALIMASASVVKNALGKPLLLLLDDPAAELDSRSLQRLMAAVAGSGCQVIATALEPSEALFPEPPRLFHVEQGRVGLANA